MAEQFTDAFVKDATIEYLSHRGEQPYRVLRGGQQLWETHAPAIRAALACANRLSPAPAPAARPPVELPLDQVWICFVEGDDKGPRIRAWTTDKARAERFRYDNVNVMEYVRRAPAVEGCCCPFDGCYPCPACIAVSEKSDAAPPPQTAAIAAGPSPGRQAEGVTSPCEFDPEGFKKYAALTTSPEPDAVREMDSAAFQNTDDAPALKVLAAVRHCAASWDKTARLLGNVRAYDIFRACNAAIAALSAPVAGAKQWHHKKSGHVVTEIGRGRVQAATPIVEMQNVVIYEHGGNMWVRAVTEFEDGRFEPAAATRNDRVTSQPDTGEAS